MGVKASRRILAMVIALAMVFTSAIGVFAASGQKKMSNTQGTNNANASTADASKGTIKVDASGKVKYSTNYGKTYKTAKGTTIKGVKGKYVIIKTDNGKSYRWVKTTKIKTIKKGKVTWKKVKGAKAYLVQITSKSGKVTWKKVKGTSLKSKKLLKKGAKVKVRPLGKKKGKIYSGALSKAKKIKK